MKERPTQASQNFASYRIPSNDGRECVATGLKIFSFSGLHRSLFTFRPYIRVGINMYRRYAGFSPASNRSAMLSHNIGPAVAGSAGPAPPPL